jgi:AcrR family transcriptional regulator
MNERALTPERVLDAAEEVLRRFGPAKATLVDVARALGVSHGSVYRHFASKSQLRDAVAERWLARIAAPLDLIATEAGDAAPRLRRWLEQLIAAKRTLAHDDPELFASYVALAGEAREVIRQHVAHLTTQAATIIADGVRQGSFTVRDPEAAGRAVFTATARFHDPVHVASWNDPQIDAAFADVWELLLRGLGGPVDATTTRPPPGADSA